VPERTALSLDTPYFTDINLHIQEYVNLQTVSLPERCRRDRKSRSPLYSCHLANPCPSNVSACISGGVRQYVQLWFAFNCIQLLPLICCHLQITFSVKDDVINNITVNLSCWTSHHTRTTRGSFSLLPGNQCGLTSHKNLESCLKIGLFWDVTPRGSCKNRRFEGT
jgi:hypothetical protein